MKAALERPSRFEFRSFSSGNYFSWSATLSIPACEHGSSQPGQPDTPTPPIVSSPTLIGRPPLSAITLVRWINGKFGLSLRRCSIVPDGARKLRAVHAFRKEFSKVCIPAPSRACPCARHSLPARPSRPRRSHSRPRPHPSLHPREPEACSQPECIPSLCSIPPRALPLSPWRCD